MKVAGDPSGVEPREPPLPDEARKNPLPAAGRVPAALRRGRQLGRVVSLLGLQIRSALGPSPKLPPGSLNPLSISRLSDDRFYRRKIARYGPIFRILWAGNLAVCVVGHRRARRLLAEHGSVLVPITIGIDDFVPKGFIRCMKPNDHAHYRRLFVDTLRADLIAGWEPELRRIVHHELADPAGAREAQGPPAERLRRTLGRIATRSLVGLFFGVRRDQAICQSLEAGFHRLGPDGFEHLIGPEQQAAFQALRSAVTSIVDSLEGEISDGCCDSVLRRMIVVAGRPAIDETVLGNAIYMVEMGRYDLLGLLRWILKYLSDNPRVVDELRRIRAVDGTAQKMAEACVLETLRLDQAEALNRYVTEEFTFEGYRIPRGCSVRILLRETHRDGDIFPDPDRFLPERFLNRQYSADEYSPFGFDHRCIAAELVVKLSTMFVEELVDGFTWSVVGDGPRHRGRHFWEPHPSFAIDLRPNAQPQPAAG